MLTLSMMMLYFKISRDQISSQVSHSRNMEGGCAELSSKQILQTFLRNEQGQFPCLHRKLWYKTLQESGRSNLVRALSIRTVQLVCSLMIAVISIVAALKELALDNSITRTTLHYFPTASLRINLPISKAFWQQVPITQK